MMTFDDNNYQNKNSAIETRKILIVQFVNVVFNVTH